MKCVSAIVLVLSSIVVAVSGNPDGAPAAACAGLSPSPGAHGAAAQVLEDNPNPYQLNLSLFPAGPDGTGLGYIPGEPVVFSLTAGDANSTATFRGFLIRAVQVMDMSFVGSFEVIDANQTELSACTPTESGITHTLNTDKSTVYMRFVGPPAGTGTIQMGYAVVKVVDIYWADLRSMQIMELPVPDATTNAPAGGGAAHLAAGSLMCLASVMAALLF